MQTKYYLIDVQGVQPLLHGPFLDVPAYEAKAQEIRNEQDPDTDLIFSLQITGETVDLYTAPGTDPRERTAGPAQK